eukprot:211151-Pelagomonas_calceolata.AAC.1
MERKGLHSCTCLRGQLSLSKKGACNLTRPICKTGTYCTKCVCSKERKKGKGYIAVPAYVGSLAEAKKVPVTYQDRSGEKDKE